MRSKIHNLYFEDAFVLQSHLKNLEEIFAGLAQLNDPMTDHDKTGVLLKSLSEPFGFIVLMVNANKMGYDAICALFKSELKRCKGRGGQEVLAPVPVDRIAENVSRNGFEKGKKLTKCWYSGKMDIL